MKAPSNFSRYGWSITYTVDGGYAPGADKLCALAEALGTTPGYLLGWD